MFATLLICAVTVLAAAAPGVALAVRDLSAAQHRADTARLATAATLLAHDLADERDDLAAAAAAPTAADGLPASALPAADRARTDRQAQDVSAAAPAGLRTALAGLPGVRRTALAAKGGPRAVVAVYQPLIDTLGRVSGPVTAPLGRAVGAAAVQRGLLVGALTADGPQPDLLAAAQAAHVQEQAALADFRSAAPADLRDGYDATVTGADTAQADRDLAELLAGPQLTDTDRQLGANPVKSALTARIGLMRSVEASAATDEAQAAADHRDHEVTVLELRAAFAALCLLLLVGVLVTHFRGLTRPLAALHLWSRADPESGQGARVIGHDEFAAVARRVNALTHEAQALRTRSQELAAERTTSLGAQSAMAAEREALLRTQSDLLRTQDDLLRSRDELAGRLTEATVRNAAHLTYVNLGLRTLGLVERQLALIEGLEDREEDPDHLETLFKLDHLATRMRRNSENLLVLAGTEHSHGANARPVPLIDVARAAISEIERYERVRIESVPDARVAGRAADDISHLVAELLDNAAGFSSPTDEILLSGWLLETGEVMLSVEDTGIGVAPQRLEELNALLADPDPAPPGAVSGMGLYVVARLAHRHGVRVQLRPKQSGGTTAVVVLPQLLLPAVHPEEPPVTPLEAALAGDPAAAATTAVLPAQREGSPYAGAGQVPAPAVPNGRVPERYGRDHRTPAEPVPDGPVPDGYGLTEPLPDGLGPVEPVPADAVSGEYRPADAVPPGAVPPGYGPVDAVPPEYLSADPVPPEHARAEPVPPVGEPAPPGAQSPGTPAGPPPSARGVAPAVPVARPGEGITVKGLPQRVPRATGLSGEPAARERGQDGGGGVDARELRRRLDGLQRGLLAGRRDSAAEIGAGAVPPGTHRAPGAAYPRDRTPLRETPGASDARGAHEPQRTYGSQGTYGPDVTYDPQDQTPLPATYEAHDPQSTYDPHLMYDTHDQHRARQAGETQGPQGSQGIPGTQGDTGNAAAQPAATAEEAPR
ncbi:MULTISPECIES: nitrate- and nitrite sensing domain-containing protein [unclassified Streptomyces]|uniref:nitrate- and nitrite sensing domain-containing protein n=1 Tax=unclassified Streptomyces TaxID=2593676 RepID=UPI002E2C959D|nr:nitrate- and nitrite sensing domain-containing protein [Streptomyces sp. NBC_00223]